MKKLFFIFFIFYFFIQTIIFLNPSGGEAVAADFSGSEVKKDLQGIKNEISELRKEVSELKKLLQLRPRPGTPQRMLTGKTAINGDPFMGNKDTPLVLVEFSDYQCPFCGRFFRDTLPQIKKEYIDTGKLKYIFKDFPLNFHKEAIKAAEASHCAGEENKYWEMHDLIFKSQKDMKVPNLIRHAKKLKLDMKKFKKCLDDSRYEKGIQEDLEAGKLAGVSGTPSFILGKLNSNGEIEGEALMGALPYQTFKTAIDRSLKRN